MPQRTAVLVVNGFDTEGRWGEFEASEATRFPWLELCLREVRRRSRGTDYELFVWDNSQIEELRAIARRYGARLFPSDEALAESREVDPKRLVSNHAGSLRRLLELVGPEFEYVMTLDTDAIPVRDGWIEQMKSHLEHAAVTGVWRDEMPQTLLPFVHPSCMLIRREVLLQIPDAFALQGVQDVGQRITIALTEARQPIGRLLRTNKRNAHFLVGGIYGDLVYHHAAGSRQPVFRLTEGQDRDFLIHSRLREAAFADFDHLVEVLRGESDDSLGLDWTPVEPVVSDRVMPWMIEAIRRGEIPPVRGAGPGLTDDWLNDLPASLSSHVAIIRNLLAAVAADERFRALQVQGSVGRGQGDALSDLDIGLVAEDELWPGICNEIPALVRQGGDVLDEYYGFVPSPQEPALLKAWAQYGNGIQLDLLVVPGSQPLGSGPDGRNLLDRDGRLFETDHPMRAATPDEIAKWAFLAWQNLTEVAKYAERDRPVAAAEWLDSARQATISCWAASHGAEYAGFANVASARFGVTVPMPPDFSSTYAGPDCAAVLSSALALAAIQSQADRLLELSLGIPPRPLAPWVTSKLKDLEAKASHSHPATRTDPEKPPTASRPRLARPARPPRR